MLTQRENVRRIQLHITTIIGEPRADSTLFSFFLWHSGDWRIMMVSNEKYQGHRVFEELSSYIEFYETLSESVFRFCSMGTRAICNIDSYVYTSIQGTLESIRDTARKGRINDAYALLRKYYDSVIINIYSNLYLKNNFSIENLIVEQINNWLQGNERLPEYRIMSNYIRSSEELTVMNNLLYQDKRYREIRDRCNDHTHYNFFHNVLLNDNSVYIKNRLQTLDVLAEDTKNIFILHLAYVFYLNGHYMSSMDYVDCLECGMTPEEGSQYWVAPFVQDVFDGVIKKERPDLATAIKQHSDMKLS